MTATSDTDKESLMTSTIVAADTNRAQQECSSPESSIQQAEFTILTSEIPEILTKQYSLDGKGELKKDPGGNIYRGKGQKYSVRSIEELQTLILGLKNNQALAFGVTDIQTYDIVTSGQWDGAGRPEHQRPRNREAFSFPDGPGVMFIDYDPKKGKEPPLTPEELNQILCSVVPGFISVKKFAIPSSSSHIFHGEEDLTGARGQRIYLLVDDASRIPEIGSWIIEYLWASGHGYILISGAGAQLERTIADQSVWDPERLDFASGAHCISPLEQRRGKGRIFSGDSEFLNTSLIIKPSQEILDRATANRRKEKEDTEEEASKVKSEWIDARVDQQIGKKASAEVRERARQIALKAVEGCELSGDFNIVVRKGGREFSVSVEQILASPKEYNGLVTLDPLENDYGGRRWVGKLYTIGKSSHLHSLAHGLKATYKLVETHRIERAEVPDTSPGLHEEEGSDMDEITECVTALERNETGDALLFCGSFHSSYVWDPSEGSNGTWYRCDGSYWAVDNCKRRYKDFEKIADKFGDVSKNFHDKKISEELAKRAKSLRTSRRRSAVLETASAYMSITPLEDGTSRWDATVGKLACKNGIVDLQTGRIRDAQPSDYIKTFCPTSYDPNAECHQFLQFLADVTLNRQELIDFIQTAFGYILLGDPKEEIILILYGPDGRNGKGALIQTLEAVLGPDIAHTFKSEMLLLQSQTRSSSAASPDLATLGGCRFAIFSEINKGRKIDASQVKNLSGRDTISCRKLFSNIDLKIKPSHTMILQTNFLPKAPADDNALWSRTRVIPFDAHFTENPDTYKNPNHKPIDEGLKARLPTEAKGILRWLIEGAKKYCREGLKVPSVVREKTDQYRTDSDAVAKFLADRCELLDGISTPKQKMQNAIKEYAEECGMEVPTKNEISAQLSERFSEVRGAGGRAWKGVRINVEDGSAD